MLFLLSLLIEYFKSFGTIRCRCKNSSDVHDEEQGEIVKFSNVHKKYGDREVISDLTFEVEENETIVLIGSNGSGKSTIINMIVGFVSPSSGEVRIFGQSSRSVAREQIRLC